MTNNKNIPDWIKQHKAQTDAEDEANSQFFKFPEGETEILVDTSTPPKQLVKFGDKNRYQYKVKVNGEDKIIEVGKQLDRQIIGALMLEMNPMVIVRVGTDIKSKYSVKGLKS